MCIIKSYLICKMMHITLICFYISVSEFNSFQKQIIENHDIRTNPRITDR